MFQGCLKLLEGERERGDLFQGCLKLLEEVSGLREREEICFRAVLNY